MAGNASILEPRLTDLEAPQLDFGHDVPEVLLDRLRMQNSALDQLRHGLAVEDGLASRDRMAEGAR